ncbi:MAG TPA: YezD family protein [Pirellulales bacterium]|jgi:hypothetical protein|nr:YezD family protein [Pirellulales bacterium]
MSNPTSPQGELNPAPATNHASAMELAMEQIRDALRGLRFGVVSIVVQDGVVVQIERTEKRRLR